MFLNGKMIYSKRIKFLTVYLVACSVILLKPSFLMAQTGVIVALTGTLEKFQSTMVETFSEKYAHREFFKGVLSGTDIILVRSPMGMVNNAVTTQVLIDRFGVQRIISIAPAGGLSGKIKIGDLVIAEQAWQHDFGTIKPYGFIWGKTPDGSGSQSIGYQQMDKELLEMAKKASESLELTKNHIVEGVVASGDSFISDDVKKEWINKKFDAIAVDMGSAAIAQASYANGIPCLILRMITDKAGINARADFGESLPEYRSAINLSEYLHLLIARIKN